MEKYEIIGGNRLDGKINIESAKNAVLPMLAGAILTDEDVVIKNCPDIADVKSMIKILKSLGVKTRFEGKNLIINAANISSYTIPPTLTGELRSSVFMFGALISRVGKAQIAYPGGCEIGLRPIDIHISALKFLGVNVLDLGGELVCNADKTVGKELCLDFPSVGATENVILASVFCMGTTVLRNAAKEPEIIDLVNFLNSMGAKIRGGGSGTIIIEGVKSLHGTVYRPICDRIEAGTYLIMGAITGGFIEISGVYPEFIYSLLHKLSNNTCKIGVKNDIITIKSEKPVKAFDFSTGVYPGFPTDLQAQTVSMLSTACGTSLVTETVFEMRYKYVFELKKMGADIDVKGMTAIVKGVKKLHGANVFAKDLRGGAALVLAALGAEGKTEVNDIFHIERGYADMEGKLRSLGADISRK